MGHFHKNLVVLAYSEIQGNGVSHYAVYFNEWFPCPINTPDDQDSNGFCPITTYSRGLIQIFLVKDSPFFTFSTLFFAQFNFPN